MLGVSLAFALAFPVFAQDKEADRVTNAGTVMKEILNAPDSIPQSVLDKADCVVILPSVLKLAIGFGGSYGRGVMTCRGGSKFNGPWGAPSMIALEGGSAGLQLGGSATDFVLLLMSPRSATNILKSKVKLGGDASAAAGRWDERPRPKRMPRCERRFFLTRALADCSLVFPLLVPRCGRIIARTRTCTARKSARRTSCSRRPCQCRTARKNCLLRCRKLRRLTRASKQDRSIR